MSRRNPFEEIEQMFDRMSSQFEGMPGGGGTQTVSMDLEDAGEEFVVTADLPGYDREDIDLSVSERTLHVSAERDESSEESDENEGGRYLRRERRRRSVSRSLSLPERVVESEASASHKNGVLTVTLPKASGEDRGSNIEIN